MGINLLEVLAQAIAFFVVFLILRWKGWAPIQSGLRARREKIRDEFAFIENAKQEVEKLKSDYQLHLQKIDDEARAKIQAAIEEGQRIAREIQEKTREESEATFRKSKQNLEIEVAKAKISLRHEIADLAILTSEKLLHEKLGSDARQQEKILEIIEELEKA